MLIYLLSLIADEGDKELFISIYEQYSRKIYAIALQILKNIDDAEDAELDTWVRVIYNFSTAKKYLSESRRAFESWVVVIAKNLSKDELRRRRRAPQPLDMWDIPAQVDTEKETEHKMLKEEIRALPNESRRIMEMRIEGRTFKEIGKVLGCNKDTAKRRYERAVNALREKMDAEQE